MKIHGKFEDLKEFMNILSYFTAIEVTTVSDFMNYNNTQWAFKDFKITLVTK